MEGSVVEKTYESGIRYYRMVRGKLVRISREEALAERKLPIESKSHKREVPKKEEEEKERKSHSPKKKETEEKKYGWVEEYLVEEKRRLEELKVPDTTSGYVALFWSRWATFRSTVEKWPLADACRGDASVFRFWIKYLQDTMEVSRDACIIGRAPKEGWELLDIDPAPLSKELLTELQECLEKVNVVILPLTLKNISKDGGGHWNMLVFDKRSKQVERFEPHGCYPGQFEWVDEAILLGLGQHSFTRDYHFVSPKAVCPLYGIQNRADAYMLERCPPASGFCVIYSMLYGHVRLLTSRTTPELVNEALGSLGCNPRDILSFILRYWRLVEAFFNGELSTRRSLVYPAASTSTAADVRLRSRPTYTLSSWIAIQKEAKKKGHKRNKIG